jgi:hypothetical protein
VTDLDGLVGTPLENGLVVFVGQIVHLTVSATARLRSSTCGIPQLE